MESSLPALPIELWRNIFLLACIIPSRFLPLDVLKTSMTPVFLSHVCWSWRYLVINCPEFWTDISYRFDSTVFIPRPSPKLMKLWLERSMAMPLTLDINISEFGDPENRSEDYAFLLALFANRKRWISATLYMRLERMDGNAWEDIGTVVEDAPLLETLKLVVEPGELEFSDFSDGLATLWNGTPKLTQLFVYFMWADDDMDDPAFISDWTLTNGIPYHQLTHLLLDPDEHGDITWDEVASIFTLAPNLVACSLRKINGHHNGVRPFTPRVVLQHLHHLDLSGAYDNSEDPDENHDLLLLMNRTLTAPSLQTLALMDPSDRWDQNAYADFIMRSNPPLTGLHFGLSRRSSSVQCLLECIRLSPPTLRSLHTDHATLCSPEFSERMSEWDEEAGKFKLCPFLQELAFDVWIRSSLPQEMVDMLRKRLCPADGSSGPFNQLNVPSYFRSKAEADLKSLMEDPYCLRVECVKRNRPEARAW